MSTLNMILIARDLQNGMGHNSLGVPSSTVSRYSGNNKKCPTCGLAYGKLRTGFTYRQVYDLMKDFHEDSSLWRYKRRHTVLGMWFSLKQQLWKMHLEECALQREFEAEEQGDSWEDSQTTVDLSNFWCIGVHANCR